MERSLRTFVIAMAVCLSALVPRAQTPPDQSAVIRVHSDLVVLHVTVRDRKTEFLPGLSRDRFQVYEDGGLQEISFFSNEDRPVTVGLVVDNSTSMWNKREEVAEAALAFARSSNPADELFTVNFNERTWFGLPGSMPFTSDLAMLEVALGRIGARGKTALYDALLLALSHIERGTQDKKVLIVVSDGGDNASTVSFERVLSAAQRSNTVIYTVGIADEGYRGGDSGVLKRLATVTGGEAFFPLAKVGGDTSPRRLKEVRNTLEHIARDIRNSYTIGYAPSNTRRDGGYRAIRVVVDVPGREKLIVRTRSGYLAPLDQSAAR